MGSEFVVAVPSAPKDSKTAMMNPVRPNQNCWTAGAPKHIHQKRQQQPTAQAQRQQPTTSLSCTSVVGSAAVHSPKQRRCARHSSLRLAVSVAPTTHPAAEGEVQNSRHVVVTFNGTENEI